MTDGSPTRQQPPTTAAGATGGAPAADRRRNPRLRELVDEMLASVRVAARRDLWTEQERKQYEAELAEIMRRVRFEAIHTDAPKDGADGAASGP